MWSTKLSLSVLVAVSLALQGCASAYHGSDPDLTLTGPAASIEHEHFAVQEVGEGYGLQPWVRMGPEKTRYSLDSVRDMITRVSPDAGKDLEREHSWRQAQWLSLALSVLVAAAAHSASDVQARGAENTMAFLGVGAAVGAGIYWHSLMSTMKDQYNQDLNRRLP